MERIIKLATSLPDGSEARTKLTGNLIKGLWDSLQHPPLSYLGDDYMYRTADGSNNVRWIKTEHCEIRQLADETLPPELHVSQAWNSRLGLRQKCQTIHTRKAIP